jgi:hypothetical protein
LVSLLSNLKICNDDKYVTFSRYYSSANVRLTFQQRVTEKKLKESNISCDA